MTFDDDLEAVRARAGSARFRIKRLGLDLSADWPWQVHDHHRPYVFGHARTHAAAVLLIDAIVNGATVVLDDHDEVIAYLAVLRLAPLVDRQTLDRVCKASLERMARRA